MGGSLGQLLLARVCGDDAIEVSDESHSRLAAPGSAVPCEALAGGHRHQILEQSVRVARPVPGVLWRKP